MRMLTIHADFIEFEPLTKALRSAPDAEQKQERYEECLVAFCSVEKSDEGKEEAVALKAAEEIDRVAQQVKPARIVIYPFVHLSSSPSSPSSAIKVLNSLEPAVRARGYETHVSPFGWYKRFTISCKGHPLSELSQMVSA
ncbi:hypothetical protein HYS54_01550 [Candidatus Micrarchaeota archaeon]|nr:hypothetical protein [Candidatus Micrarchaeota archaeon]